MDSSKPFRNIAKLHKALANERRLLVLSTIAKLKIPFGYSVVELAKNLQLPYKSLSKHLQILDQANLIERTRHGRAIGYTPTSEGRKVLSSF